MQSTAAGWRSAIDVDELVATLAHLDSAAVATRSATESTVKSATEMGAGVTTGFVTDADRIDQLADLERLKAACAAAQARITSAFVESQALVAQDWARESQDHFAGGDFQGWRTSRDEALRAAFDPSVHPLTRRATSGPDHAGPDHAGPDHAGPDHAGPDHAGSAGQDTAGVGADADRRPRRSSRPRAGSGVAAQVGLARHESPNKGGRLTTAALTLTRDLPHTLAALTRGLLNERRAELVAREVNHLHPAMRAQVDADVIGLAGDGVSAWGDRELEHRVRARADHLDAEAAVARARTAESERRVTLRPIPDTMARLSADLPVAQAVATLAALRAAAATAKANGDPRTQGQLMADTLVERVTGATVSELATPPVKPRSNAARDSAAAPDPTPAAHSTSTGPAGMTHASGAEAAAPAAASEPGQRAPASEAAACEQGTTASQTCQSPPDRAPTESHTSADTEPERPPSPPPGPPPTGPPPAEPPMPPTPPVTGIPIEIQVVITDRALLRGDDTPAFIPGYGPVPAAWARELLMGHVDVRGDPERPLAKVWLRRLYTHPSTGALVAMESSRRLFPDGLRRYLMTRDRTCRTPWCDAPIRQSDHVRPHAEGGPTTAANGEGLCVACNLVHEGVGFQARVLHDGMEGDTPHTIELRTPTGHRYTSTAPPVLPGGEGLRLHSRSSGGPAARPGHRRRRAAIGSSPFERHLARQLQ